MQEVVTQQVVGDTTHEHNHAPLHDQEAPTGRGC